MPVSQRKISSGFTLIELVIGIMVFAIAISLFLSLIVPQARRSVDPMLQVRASELAQSLMSEIASKAFDENSSRHGGTSRCNENSNNCTVSRLLGEDLGESRNTYNDVDDYNGLNESGAIIQNSLGASISLDGSLLYEGFSAQVSVYYDDDMDGIDDAITGGPNNIGNTKLIRITVTTPTGENIIFSSYRSNY
ncbi:type II secretion system protein [Paraglaciecola sp.]|uniref:type IV pilus modification PilV family protein n=1 Tax=Paraglaciecola sp. TaxID=1920173 RepID=UPI0030F4244C